MALTVGDRLGPYEIVSAIGAGGMGDVWKARDTRLNRVVAIKQLKMQHTARFEHEARAIAALNHPHICTLYDIGPDYLVLEYVEGAPLQGPVPAAEALRLGAQIAGALEAAHQKGILHRDLKPANIVVSGGSAKLLDFGLAKLMTEGDAPGGPGSDVTKTVEGTVLGTVAYMSPEQAQGRSLDARSDVFSFGVVLYELLSGRRAFPGESNAQIVSAVLRDDPPPCAMPDALSRIVTRCLRKDPAERFQRMADVKAALEQAGHEPAGQRASIAVLPFADMSPDKDQEYFSDGLAEEVINALAQVRGLKVIARTSTFAFKGQNTDIRRIAETLGVAHVLEGSVRKAGSRIRVSAQLIIAADGSHLWSERFDRELADVFAVQDEIAAAIVGALEAKLSARPTQDRKYTPTLPAYDAYLKGKHDHWKVTPESLARSRESFEQAIALDPGFAHPHVGLSHHYFMLAMFSLMPAHQAMPLVRAEARRALQLDGSLNAAHGMLGVVAGLYDYDWTEAWRLFGLAMARDPVPSEVRATYGSLYLMYQGRAAEAVEEIERALTDDPLSVSLRYLLGASLSAAGRDVEATAELRHVLELDEKFMTAIAILALAHASAGDLHEARARAEQAFALAPWDPVTIGLLAGVLDRTGDSGRAKVTIDTLGDGAAFGAPIGLMIFQLLAGDVDRAADWLEKAVAQRYPGILFFVHLALGRALRASPRWPALARLMNLTASIEGGAAPAV